MERNKERYDTNKYFYLNEKQVVQNSIYFQLTPITIVFQTSPPLTLFRGLKKKKADKSTL